MNSSLNVYKKQFFSSKKVVDSKDAASLGKKISTFNLPHDSFSLNPNNPKYKTTEKLGFNELSTKMNSEFTNCLENDEKDKEKGKIIEKNSHLFEFNNTDNLDSSFDSSYSGEEGDEHDNDNDDNNEENNMYSNTKFVDYADNKTTDSMLISELSDFNNYNNTISINDAAHSFPNYKAEDSTAFNNFNHHINKKGKSTKEKNDLIYSFKIQSQDKLSKYSFKSLHNNKADIGITKPIKKIFDF